MEDTVWIVGGGLAGTLLGLEFERLGRRFRWFDQGSGATSSQVAAGLFNPLLGPRMSPDPGDWSELATRYRDWEKRLAAKFFYPMPMRRPLRGTKVTEADFPRKGQGWEAVVEGEEVFITGGGWVDLPVLLAAARKRGLARGVLEQRLVPAEEAQGHKVVWCGGLADFSSPAWQNDPLVKGRWQAVRGDLLTLKAPQCRQEHISIGVRFLLPLGKGLFRFGATHESDVLSMDERPLVRDHLLAEAALVPGLGNFELIDHRWGIRPASRTLEPLVGRHATQENWFLFNGFSGKGVSAIPRQLGAIVQLVWP